MTPKTSKDWTELCCAATPKTSNWDKNFPIQTYNKKKTIIIKFLFMYLDGNPITESYPQDKPIIQDYLFLILTLHFVVRYLVSLPCFGLKIFIETFIILLLIIFFPKHLSKLRQYLKSEMYIELFNRAANFQSVVEIRQFCFADTFGVFLNRQSCWWSNRQPDGSICKCFAFL